VRRSAKRRPLLFSDEKLGETTIFREDGVTNLACDKVLFLVAAIVRQVVAVILHVAFKTWETVSFARRVKVVFPVSPYEQLSIVAKSSAWLDYLEFLKLPRPPFE
jgi:hypothetical protein